MYTTSLKSNSTRLAYHLCAIIVVFFASISFLQAQNLQWQNCLSNEDVRDIKSDANTVWIATTGGLIQLNDQLEEIARYTSLNSGLACNHIQEIVIDGEGVVWIHHCYGLSSFDGNTFVDYDIDITKMVLDHNQNMFLVDEDGFHTWNGSVFDFTMLESPNQYLSLGDVYVESDEVVWVSRFTFGIFQIHRFENGQLSVFDNSNSELSIWYPSNGIFVKGNDNKLAIALGNEIFTFDDITWTSSSLIDKQIVDLQVNENGEIDALFSEYFAGSQRAYIGQLSEDYEIISETLQELEGKYPQVLSISEANILVGSLETGLQKVQENEVIKVNLTKTDLISNSIRSMNIVDEKIWIHAGRSEYDRVGSILTIDDFIWEENKGTFPFLETNNISLNFDVGLGDTTYLNYDRKSFYQTDNNDWTLVDNPDLVEGIDENYVSVFIDTYGHKWLLELYTSDIYYQSPTGWKIFPHEIHGAASAAYFSKFNHPETNDLWLSTYNGVSIYNYESDSWTLVDHSDMNVSYDPITFVTTSTGEIFGFARNEFFRLDQNLAEVLITSDTIGLGDSFRFWSIMVDSKDRILLGLNGLVAVYDNGEWSYLTRENSSMVNGNITSIQEDEAGNYWFGSSTGGIAIYNEDGLDDQFFTSIHTDVEDVENAHTIEIYPIPTTGVVNFKSISKNLAKEVKQIKIFDFSGNNVMSVNSIKDNSLDLSSLSSGVYVLHIQLDSEVYNVKVIKI